MILDQLLRDDIHTFDRTNRRKGEIVLEDDVWMIAFHGIVLLGRETGSLRAPYRVRRN